MSTPEALTHGGLLRRVALALTLVGAAAIGAYALLVPLVLGTEHSQRDGAVLGGLWAGAAVLAVLFLHALTLSPVLARTAADCTAGERSLASDRLALYAAPRRAAAFLALLALGVLVAGHVPFDGAAPEWRATAANVGAVCAVLGGLVLYAAMRLALRPVLEALPADPEADADLDADARRATDRLAFRVTAAVAVPAGAAALVVTLIVAAHTGAVADDAVTAETEVVNLALSVEQLRDEPPQASAVAVAALRRAGVAVVSTPGADPVVAPRESTPQRSRLWAIPIAAAVALLAAQLGRRIGRSASMDVETAARRMAVVGAANIRSVTMHMVRPRSVPEIRDMALALDTLAATLLRMADDQKRAVSARSDASRLRSFVLASVSHDVRGPLNSVLGFAELLLSGVEGELTDGQKESLQALARGGHDLLRLVDDLLDHARLDAGRMTLERSRVAMDRVVEHARAGALERTKGPLAPERVAIEGEIGLIALADEERLARALGALVAYALLRPGSDGHAVLRTRREGAGVAVDVRGGGSTPSREALQGLFEPFDFAPTGARAPAGLNLAVWVARGIVELHGGRAEAYARDEGGLVLSITLPGPQPPPRPPSARAAPPAQPA